MLVRCAPLTRFVNLVNLGIHGGLAEGTIWHMDLGEEFVLCDNVFLKVLIIFYEAVADVVPHRKRGKPLTLAGKLLELARKEEIVSFLDGAATLVFGDKRKLG